MADDSGAKEAEQHIIEVVSCLGRGAVINCAAVQCRLLHTLHLLLSERCPAPLSPGSVASNLLPVLVALVNHHAARRACPSEDNKEHIVHSLLVTDAVAAIVNAALRPALDELLRMLELGQAAAAAQRAIDDWTPAVDVLLGKQLPDPEHYRSWVAALANFVITSDDVPGLTPRSYPGAIRVGHDGECVFWEQRHLPSTPGAATMLALGSIRMLQAVMGTASEFLPWMFVKSDQQAAASKLVLALTQDGRHLRIPDGALAHALFSQLLDSGGLLCKPLLDSPSALKALARPLHDLAEDRYAWMDGPYAYHVQVLAYLCQWTASTLGLSGVQQLARVFTPPAIRAVDFLLELPAEHRPAAAHLVRSCLLLLTHLACTGFGQRSLKSHAVMIPWLMLACDSWQQQLPVLQHIALLARAPLVNYSRELYFSPLYRDRSWQFRLVATDGIAATSDQSATSGGQVLSQITVLLDSAEDKVTKAILIDLLARITKAKGIILPAAAGTLMELATPSSSPRECDALPSEAAASDLDLYLAAAGLSWQVTQQKALGLTLKCFWQRMRAATVTAHLSGIDSASDDVVAEVKQILLEWFKQPSSSALLSNRDPTARIMLLCHLEGCLKADLLLLDAGDKHVLLDGCGAMLQHMHTADEVSVALHALFLVMSNGDCSSASLAQLSCVLADPAALATVMAFMDGRLGRFLPASGSYDRSSRPNDLVPPGPAGWEEEPLDVNDVRQMVLPLNVLFMAALNWVVQPEVEHYHAAATRLLLGDAVWEKVEQLTRFGRLEQPERQLSSVWMFLLPFTLERHKGPFSALASDVCTMLGEGKVASMIQLMLAGESPEGSERLQRTLHCMGGGTAAAAAIAGSVALWDAQLAAVMGEAEDVDMSCWGPRGRRMCGKMCGNRGNASGTSGSGRSSSSSSTVQGMAGSGLTATDTRAAGAMGRNDADRDVCSRCDKRTRLLRPCPGCNTARYCSEICQAADWQQHQHECTKVQQG